MALGTFRPGAYTGTLGGVAMGLTTGEGFKLRYKRKNIKVNNTGAYGDCLIDGINRGIGDVQLIWTFKEFGATVQKAIWPYGTGSPPTFDGTIGVIGGLDSAAALPIVLTPATSTPAVTNSVSNGVFTASLAILAGDNDMEFLFGPVETDVPVVFDLLLYDDSGTKRFFKWS